MEKRIDIDWEESTKTGDQTIVGLVRIMQGKSCMEMEEVGRCIVEISSSGSGINKALRPAPNRDYLPPETADEGVSEAIYALAQAYLYGLNAKLHLYFWMEVD